MELAVLITPQTSRFSHVPDIQRDTQRNQRQQPGNIQNNLVDEIEPALQQANVKQQPENFPVERRQDSAHEQDDHAPHQVGVHDPHRLIFGDDFFRQDPEGQKVAKLGAEIVELEFSPARPPQAYMAIDAIGKDQYGNQCANIN